MSRLSRIESCASCALASSPRLATPLNLFAYTFCKITLCGLHPTSPLPPFHPFGRPSAARCASLQPLPAFVAERQTTLQVSPKVPNVCGTIRQKFQVRHGRVRRLYDEFPPSRSLFAALARQGTRIARQDSPSA